MEDHDALKGLLVKGRAHLTGQEKAPSLGQPKRGWPRSLDERSGPGAEGALGRASARDERNERCTLRRPEPRGSRALTADRVKKPSRATPLPQKLRGPFYFSCTPVALAPGKKIRRGYSIRAAATTPSRTAIGQLPTSR
jgi:hypothetical protein